MLFRVFIPILWLFGAFKWASKPYDSRLEPCSASVLWDPFWDCIYALFVHIQRDQNGPLFADFRLFSKFIGETHGLRKCQHVVSIGSQSCDFRRFEPLFRCQHRSPAHWANTFRIRFQRASSWPGFSLHKCYSAHCMRRKRAEIVKLNVLHTSWKTTWSTSESMRFFRKQEFSLKAWYAAVYTDA